MEEMNKNDQLQTETTEKNKKDKEQLTGWPRVKKEIREWVLALVTALVAVLILKEFVFLPIRVDGSSMSPTLLSGERLLVTVYDVKISNKIQRGDVVICNYPGRTNKDPFLKIFTMDTNFVKRVVGMPGDTVSRVSGVTYINGEPLDPRAKSTYRTAKVENGKYIINGVERELTLEETRSYKFDYEYVLKEDEYFVVGDNRYNSHDSRTWNGPDIERVYVNDASGDVGPITKDMIVGRAKCVFWPLNEWETVQTDTEYVDPRDRTTPEQ